MNQFAGIVFCMILSGGQVMANDFQIKRVPYPQPETRIGPGFQITGVRIIKYSVVQWKNLEGRSFRSKPLSTNEAHALESRLHLQGITNVKIIQRLEKTFPSGGGGCGPTVACAR